MPLAPDLLPRAPGSARADTDEQPGQGSLRAGSSAPGTAAGETEGAGTASSARPLTDATREPSIIAAGAPGAAVAAGGSYASSAARGPAGDFLGTTEPAPAAGVLATFAGAAAQALTSVTATALERIVDVLLARVPPPAPAGASTAAAAPSAPASSSFGPGAASSPPGPGAASSPPGPGAAPPSSGLGAASSSPGPGAAPPSSGLGTPSWSPGPGPAPPSSGPAAPWSPSGPATTTSASPPAAAGSPPPPGFVAPAPIAAPSAALYTDATLRTDLAQVLQRRLPIYSNRNLGNPDNVAKWSDAKRASLWRGIQTAQARFFPTMSLADLAHLILAEGAQESTGDWSQGGGGFLQVTQETVVADYRHHGQPVPGPDGRAIIDPAGPIDLTDPGQNVALWAWYTRNAVAAGISANEVQMPEHRRGGVTRDFGNAQWAWLGGPGNDRHGSSNAGLKDYHDRVKDYFVQAGFGTPEQFEALLDAPVLPTLAYMTDRLAGHAATP